MPQLPVAPSTPLNVPDGWGDDCLPWLAANGITPRPTIPLRSSLYALALEDPFLLYLTEILGLTFPYSYSKALSRGSWAHKRMEAIALSPPAVKTFMENAFAARIAEIKETSSLYGAAASPDSLDSLIARETRDFKCAWGWHEAASVLPLPAGALPNPVTFKDLLTNGSLRLLASELLLSMEHPDFPNTPFVVRIDQLYYDESSNQLWILDYKTCAEVPSVRLSSCAIEFQTQHYIFVFQYFLRNHLGLLKQRILNFPDAPIFAGMMHLAHQKPTIDFGRNDRPFKWVSRVLKSGPRKGLEIREKDYEDAPPSFDLYIERCGHWYSGTGEYIEDAIERIQNPPVNISFTPVDIALDTPGIAQYHARLRFIHSLLIRPPFPGNYLINPASMRRNGKISEYAPFYLCAPAQWPDIIAMKGLVQKYRDDHIDPLSTGVHEWTSPNP